MKPFEDVPRIRVFVAESNHMASQLMQSVLLRQRKAFAVQAMTSGWEETVRQLDQHQPHVALISAELQDGLLAGFRVLQHLRDAKSNTAPIMLLNSMERDLMIDSFRFGARGVITRTHCITALPKCIRAVHNGQVWVNNEQIEVLLELVSRIRPLQIAKPGGMALLTHREREVLGFVAEGLRNEEIAQKLLITEHTVRNYICHVSEKLGLSTRVELVLYALSR